MKSLICLTAMALAVAPPVLEAAPSIPSAAFQKSREATPEELEEGTPLSVLVRKVKAIQKDAKTKDGLPELWATMTPTLAKELQYFGPTFFRKNNVYMNIATIDLTKPVKFRLRVTTPEWFIGVAYFTAKPTCAGTQCFYYKKVDGKWLEASMDEVPAEYQPGYKR